ncbi:MAG: TetR/AcrR family transcriptional regulator [Actinomycetota bacterium]
MIEHPGEGTGGKRRTPTALLDAAEEHFALHGFQRASLRAVMRAAGADPGAVHYHFGGRPELAAAVLDRVLVPLNARRLDLLDRAVERAGGHPVPLVDLVEALLRPDLELAAALEERGTGRARLAGAVYLDPAAFVTEQVERHFGPVAGRFKPELARTLPELDPAVVAWRIRWLLFGTLGAVLADPVEPFRQPVDVLAVHLAADLAAAIGAPAPLHEPRPDPSGPEHARPVRTDPDGTAPGTARTD